MTTTPAVRAVPREPTDAMRDAVKRYYGTGSEMVDLCGELWVVMYDAAVSPATPGADEDVALWNAGRELMAEQRETITRLRTELQQARELLEGWDKWAHAIGYAAPRYPPADETRAFLAAHGATKGAKT